MNFHEYQAKQLFAQYGIAVPPGKIATTPEAAVDAARALGGDEWVVKAQIHAGGRGKAGGVKLVKTLDEVKAASAKMLGTKMTTYQSAGRALPVNVVLITEASDIAKELYLSVLVDRATKSVAFIASARGGVDIEQGRATRNPEDILDARSGTSCRVCSRTSAASSRLRWASMPSRPTSSPRSCSGCTSCSTKKTSRWSNSTRSRSTRLAILVALDGKVNSDDNAEFRHHDLAAMRDESQEDARPRRSRVRHNLNYVTMDGDIGCMVNEPAPASRWRRWT